MKNNINNEFCPRGHKWIFIGSSLLYSGYYYCPKCDKIYKPTVREVTKEEIENNFNNRRYNEMKDLAKYIEARKKVTKNDLKKLGYL